MEENNDQVKIFTSRTFPTFMFTSNCQLAWSSYTRLGGRSWRLDLRPSSARPPYSIGTCNIHTISTCSRKSSEIPLESNRHCFQSSTGDLVGIKSKCCGEGRSAYWICGGPTLVLLPHCSHTCIVTTLFILLHLPQNGDN